MSLLFKEHRLMIMRAGAFRRTEGLEMIASKTYVRSDENGALKVGSTRVSVDSVVYAFQQGHSAEMIVEQYPAVSLEEVYGTVAFYLANREEVDQYLDQQAKLWDALRQKADQTPSPVVERLRALRRTQERGEE